MMKKFFLAITLFSLTFATTGKAQDAASSTPVRLLLEGGIEFGGDELFTVLFTTGGDQTIRAGQGGYLAVGAQFDVPSVKQLMFRGSLGYKYVTTAADNANITFTRMPLNLMAYFRPNPAFRIGLGTARHLNVQLKGDGFFADQEMDSKWGARFEVGYRAVALTYTTMTYVDETGGEGSGNSIGLSLSFLIPGE